MTDAIKNISAGHLQQADFGDLMGRWNLVRLILEVQTHEWPKRSQTTQANSRQNLSVPIALTLLTYSYARGLYGSDEIASKIRSDEALRYICARTYPSSAQLRQFRRHNRDILLRTLTSVLMGAWKYSLCFASTIHPAGLIPDGCVCQAAEGAADDQFCKAAEARVSGATFLDSIMLDD